MLIQARSLISSGQLSIGSLLTFFLYQKPMSVNLRVSLSVWKKNRQQWSAANDQWLTFVTGDHVLPWRNNVHGWGHCQGAELPGQGTKVQEGRRLVSGEAGGENCFPRCLLQLPLCSSRSIRSEGLCLLAWRRIMSNCWKKPQLCYFPSSQCRWSCSRGRSRAWWVSLETARLLVSACWRGCMNLRRVRSC